MFTDYKNMKLVLTQKVRKDIEFVNGMQCEVEDFEENEHGDVLRVRLETGRRLPVTIWTDVRKQEVRYFPVLGGCGSTLHEAQGRERGDTST